MYETKPNLFKLDVRKIFSKKLKFKSRISNFNKSKLLKYARPSKENKNSQTNIKKYNYELSNIIKPNNLTESINLIPSLKDKFPQEIEKKEKNKAKIFSFRRSVSLKPNKLNTSFRFD